MYLSRFFNGGLHPDWLFQTLLIEILDCHLNGLVAMFLSADALVYIDCYERSNHNVWEFVSFTFSIGNELIEGII